MSDSVRSLDGGDAKLGGWNHEPLIHEHLGSRRMVHGHQIQIVVVVGFPQFRSKAQIVITIVRNEFVWTDLVPLFRSFDARRTNRVDSESDRGTPRHRVLHKFDLLTVVSEQEWARTLQSLLGHNFLIGFQIEFGAD